MPKKHVQGPPSWLRFKLLLLLWMGVLALFALFLDPMAQGRLWHQEIQYYTTVFGPELTGALVHTGEILYRHLMVDTGFHHLLNDYTRADGQSGEGFVWFLNHCRRAAQGLTLMVLMLCLRVALLWVCLPYWLVVLLASISDGYWGRRIRYYSFDHSSGWRYSWSWKGCVAVPWSMAFLVMLPWPIPAYVLPCLMVLFCALTGIWIRNWRKEL